MRGSTPIQNVCRKTAATYFLHESFLSFFRHHGKPLRKNALAAPRKIGGIALQTKFSKLLEAVCSLCNLSFFFQAFERQA